MLILEYLQQYCGMYTVRRTIYHVWNCFCDIFLPYQSCCAGCNSEVLRYHEAKSRNLTGTAEIRRPSSVFIKVLPHVSLQFDSSPISECSRNSRDPSPIPHPFLHYKTRLALMSADTNESKRLQGRRREFANRIPIRAIGPIKKPSWIRPRGN